MRNQGLERRRHRRWTASVAIRR